MLATIYNYAQNNHFAHSYIAYNDMYPEA